MKTDRELLELAEKAAGLNVKGEWVDGDDKFTHLNIGKKFTNERMKWNPLTDDGDALRLAVKLRLSIIQEEEFILGEYLQPVEVMSEERADGSRICTMQSLDDDHMAATRRAITDAAAQIQLNKEQTNG